MEEEIKYDEMDTTLTNIAQVCCRYYDNLTKGCPPDLAKNLVREWHRNAMVKIFPPPEPTVVVNNSNIPKADKPPVKP